MTTLRDRLVQELAYHGHPYREIKVVVSGLDDAGRQFVRASIVNADGVEWHDMFRGGAHPNILLDSCVEAYGRHSREDF